MKTRFLSLDVGTKRIGLAWSDTIHLLASPLGTFSNKEIWTRLETIMDEHSIEAIIIGWPYTMDGKEEASVRMVQSFQGELKKKFPSTAIIPRDERMTSVLAKESILSAGYSKKKRRNKGLVDSTAATILLQEFLDEQR